MKTKTMYVQPQMEVMTLNMGNMIALSGGGLSEGEQRTLGVGSVDEEVDASAALSKGRSSDGFDWDLDL